MIRLHYLHEVSTHTLSRHPEDSNKAIYTDGLLPVYSVSINYQVCFASHHVRLEGMTQCHTYQ